MEPTAPTLRRLLTLSALTTLLFVAAMVLAGSLLLLLVATTPGGRLTALALVLALPSLAALPFAWSSGRREPATALCAAGLLLGALFGGWALHIAPEARTSPGPGLYTVYLTDASHPRASIANLVPERDQFTLGSWLFPFVDPFLDAEQSERVRTLFQRVYAEADADPALADSGSAMAWSYAELFGRRWDVGHLYVYEPATSSPEPRPVLLFLHGWGGPFLGYQEVLRRFADAQGYAVVSPSFGMGWWDQTGAMPALERALAWIDAQPGLDGQRVVLAGLSNGGVGVVRAAVAFPDRWRGVVFLSGVMEASRLAALALSLVDHDTPALVITGADERRIPLEYTQGCVDVLRAGEVRLDLEVFSGEDHFLLFSQPDTVMALLGRWVETEVGEPTPARNAPDPPAPPG
ncbi:MAG: hypothetical protein ABIO70_04090 [Pseudomonadota bacterium]